MKRNFDLPVLDLDGKPFGDSATLKSIAFMALTVPVEGDDKLPLEQKLKQYTLTQTIHKGGIVDISAEDIALIKQRASRCLSILALGRLCEMLEAEEPTPEEAKGALHKKGK